MNRVVWSALEAMTRKFALEKGGQEREVFVVTGPLWIPMGVASSNSRSKKKQDGTLALRDCYISYILTKASEIRRN